MENKIKLTQKCYHSNKWTYITFVACALLFMIIKDFNTAFIFGSLALVFDPFDQGMKHENRPKYQRVLLYSHVLVMIISFIVYMIFTFKK